VQIHINKKEYPPFFFQHLTIVWSSSYFDLASLLFHFVGNIIWLLWCFKLLTLFASLVGMMFLHLFKLAIKSLVLWWRFFLITKHYSTLKWGSHVVNTLFLIFILTSANQLVKSFSLPYYPMVKFDNKCWFELILR